MIDSGNMKQKDKELEKIEIRKQASDPLPTIPPTPVTPPDDNRIMPSEIIPTRDPEPSRGLANDENLVVTTKDAEVASVSSEEGDDELTTNDITADNDDTGSMISSISCKLLQQWLFSCLDFLRQMWIDINMLIVNLILVVDKIF